MTNGEGRAEFKAFVYCRQRGVKEDDVARISVTTVESRGKDSGAPPELERWRRQGCSH